MPFKNHDHIEFIWNGKKVVAEVLDWNGDNLKDAPVALRNCAVLHSPMFGGTNLEAIERDWLEKNAKITDMSMKEINELWKPYYLAAMRVTVGQLKKELLKYPDDWIIYIERIEDVYFEKHGWTTEKFVWIKDCDETEGTEASAIGSKEGKVIITAHY